VAASLKAKDAAKLNNALEALRRSQASVNKLETAASSGKEATTVSPFLWGDRARVRSLYRILAPVDNVIRNARVLARRAVVLTEDNDTVSDQQIHVIEEIADIALRLSDLYEHHKEISEALEIPELV